MTFLWMDRHRDRKFVSKRHNSRPQWQPLNPVQGMDRNGRKGIAGVGRRFGGWVLAALCALLAGCAEPPPHPLAVGMNAWVGYDPLVLARDRGLVDARRLQVVELASAAEVQRSLRNGLLDAAALTLDEVMRLNHAGMDLRVVAVLDESAGADAVMAVPRITRPAQLRGEFVAVEDASVGALLLQRMLQGAGLQRADIVVVNIEAGQHLRALQEGRVAAAVTYAPITGPMRDAGFVTLFDSARIPGEIVDVLAVRREVIAQRPDAVDALLRAWDAGLQQLQRDPAQAAEALARGSDITPADYRQVLGGLHFVPLAASARWLAGPAPTLRDGAARVGQALVDMGALPAPPALDGLIDAAPLQRVLAAPVPGSAP